MLKREKQRKARKVFRVRKNIFGTGEQPRLTVFRSAKHIYAQLIDDTQGKTLVSASTISNEIADALKDAKSKIDKSKLVGKLLGERASDLKIKKVVFDRGGFTYHGRVKAVAEGAREAGLKF
ncbi:MAG: 50S ribosomal protein L18 [Bacteroidota bacterium]